MRDFSGAGLRVEKLEDRRMLSIQPVQPPAYDAQEFATFVASLPQVAPGIYSLEGITPTLPMDALSTNVNAADTTNADQLWTGGGLGLNLTGSGVTVGVWDGGAVRSTHQEFANGSRVALIDALGVNNPASNHATHVAGTIGAQGAVANAHGMASQVAIRSRNYNNDAAELLSDASVLDLSNHSYGFLRGWTDRIDWPTLPPVDTWVADRALFTQDPLFGKYAGAQSPVDAALGLSLVTPQALDDTLSDNPHLLSVWAAGNDRNESFTNLSGAGFYVAYSSSAGVFQLFDASVHPAPLGDGVIDGGFDTLPQSQVAKNTLVVGAIDDITVDPYTSANATITAFSNWGMTDDGRIKPDVVANGESLLSSLAYSDVNETIASNVTYGTFSGTSMAAPNVTGTAALLVQHYRNLFGGASPLSATTKALLTHTAKDAGNVGPDYTYGWGVVDAAAAANFLTNSAASASQTLMQQVTYAGSEWTKSIVSDGTAPLKVSIAWTDLAPTTLPGSGLDASTSVLVNDLDVWITGPGGTYRPWTLNRNNPSAAAVRNAANHVDNVEQVLIDAPAAGVYTIHVGHAVNSFTQSFSLLGSGIDDVSVPPTSVDLVNSATYDTGTSSTDNITSRDNSSAAKNLQFSVAGTIAGATVRVYANNGSGPVQIGSAVATGSTTVITTNGSVDVLDGLRTITATQTEPNRLASTAVQSSVTIDTVAPLVPSIPDLLTADDTGSSNVDNITKITTPRFTGTAEAGATITLLEGAASRGTGVAAGGVWTITSSALSSAAHSLKARATDVAGNVSVDSSTLAITVDTLAPSAPSIPDLLAADDGGQSNVDNLTNLTTPRFTGTAEAGATITLLEGAATLGTSVATGGAWTVTSSALSSTLHNVKARATDIAGNASVDSSTLAVTIDSIAPRVAGVAIIGTNSNDVGGGRYPIPTGSGLQLKTVPIGGAYRIEIEFNKPMDVSMITNSVLWLVNKQGGPTITPNGATVTASAGNTKFTWEFVNKPFAAAAYQLTLSNNVIKSVAGANLDGEFTNPVDVDQPPAAVLNLPSGDGSPGGAFTFDFVNLPSDSNRDNVVNSQDLIVWKNNYGGSDSFTTGDGGGDGTTDGTDFLQWQQKLGKNFVNLVLANAEATSHVTVAGVTISGSNSAHDAYVVPTGSGEQLRTIPLGGADTIAITFSSDVTLVGDELSIYGADSGANYGLVFEGYDALTYTASWRVADGVLPHDQLIVELAEGVVDSLGAPVDPEWRNPQVVASTDDYLRDLSGVGAGDGFVGGAFRFHLNVLPGDFNLDNKVDMDDLYIQVANYGTPSGAVFTDGDFDGDGDVDVDDDNAFSAVLTASVNYTTFTDVVAPRVANVWFDGSNSTHAPYMVPTGSGEQLRTVPLGGIDTIKLAFDEGVILNGTELSVYGVKTGTTYTLDYIGNGGGVATWKLVGGATFPAEQLLLRLDDSIVDAAGNSLDGEFTNPWTLVDSSGSSSSMPSGDGEAGGDFRFRATILPGDFNRDNVYNSADMSIYTSNFGLTPATHADGDISGDGVVDGSDFLKLQTQAANDFTNWKSIEPGMILVSSAADEGDDSDYSIGDVTLREALARAYAQAGDDVIAFRDTLSGQTINLSLGQLTINSNVTINGLGADASTVLANGTSRVFSVNSGVTAAISGLTISGGGVNGDGAGIYNAGGNLTLSGVVVTDNHATGLSGLGGGLFSTGGSVTVTDSEFHGNTATRGGAIRTQFGTTLSINGSAFYGNAASNVEGALSTHQTTATIKNSTFSGNSATNGGGAIRTNSTGQMTIINSTIVNNTTTGYGGGIQVTGTGTVTLHNTILAANTAGDSASQDVNGALNAASSYNLIGQVGGSGLTNGVNGNLVGTLTVRIDPLLGALADNGGPTKTHALLEGSLAIDAGNNDEADDLLFDQRRRARLVDGDDDGDLRVDIGAYEVEYDEFFASLGA